MNQLLKMLLELGPLLAFFVAYRVSDGDIIVATLTIMAAVVISLGISLLWTGKAPRMLLITVAMVIVFGGLTVWLADATFIKMKPTIIYVLFALAPGYGLLRGTNYLRYFLGESISMDERGWRLMTLRWVAFFLAMAALNELVWRTQSEETWVTIKTFVYLPITLAFVFLQLPLIRRHWIQKPAPDTPADV